MTLAVGLETKLLAGLAELLAAAGVGQWAPAGQPNGTDPWIALWNVPAAPDQVVTLAVYGEVPRAALTDTAVQVQVRTRGTRVPGTAADLLAAADTQLHGLRRRTLGTAPNQLMIVQMVRTSRATLGFDTNSRLELTANYDVALNRVTAALTTDA